MLTVRSTDILFAKKPELFKKRISVQKDRDGLQAELWGTREFYEHMGTINWSAVFTAMDTRRIRAYASKFDAPFAAYAVERRMIINLLFQQESWPESDVKPSENPLYERIRL